MESPGNSNGQRTVSGSPGRAEQGVAGIPPGMDAHLSGAPCQSGCQGFVGQGLPALTLQTCSLDIVSVNGGSIVSFVENLSFVSEQHV